MIRLVALIVICISSGRGMAEAPMHTALPEGYGAIRSARGPFVIRYEQRFERMAMRVEELLADSWRDLSRELGIERVDTIVVYVTGDIGVYRALHGGFVPEWGAAFCNSARREIGVNADAVLKSTRPISVVIRHELSHVFLADRVAGARVPRWFAEGLAMRQAAEWTFGHQWELVSSIWSDRLPYVEDFEGPLPRNAEDAQLAYGVAYCAVEELLGERPEDVVTLTAYVRDLGDFDRAFTLTFGEAPVDFSTRLHALLLDRYGATAVLIRSIPYWGGVTVLFLAAFLFKLARGRRKLREWESEDEAALRRF